MRIYCVKVNRGQQFSSIMIKKKEEEKENSLFRIKHIQLIFVNIII